MPSLLAWEAHTLGRIREGKYSMRKHGLSRAGAASALLQHPELHVAPLANTSWLFAHDGASGELKQHWAIRITRCHAQGRVAMFFCPHLMCKGRGWLYRLWSK